MSATPKPQPQPKPKPRKNGAGWKENQGHGGCPPAQQPSRGRGGGRNS